MMKHFSTVVAMLLAMAVLPLMGREAQATTALADQPVFTISSVPGNILFTLSVEFPTAISTAFPSNALPYSPTSSFIGYFDPGKCYLYHPDTVNNPPVNGYFTPYSLSTSHLCPETASTPLWSGSYLNWASMQTIDEFRMALTGGYRSVDTPTQTILEKAWASHQGSDGFNAPDKITSNGVYGATPFNWTSASSRIWSLGNSLYITGTQAVTSHGQTCSVLSGGVINNHGTWQCNNYNGVFGFYPTYPGNIPPGFVAYTNQEGNVDPTQIYALQMRVLVCDPTVSLEGDCVQYQSGYKPEGLIQQNAKKIRYGVMSYLNTSSRTVEGGVLRARMEYVGPTMPSANPNVFIPNPNTEWDPTFGTYITNPDPADALASGVTNSGVINYLNKFGESSHTYRTFDVVGELFYAASRYFKDQGPVSTYYANASGSALDGFPAIRNWNPAPIQYACQKNFFVGIGDTNTWDDAQLPGSSLTDPTQTVTPPEVTADTTENVTQSTNYIGQMEGLGNLGSVWKNGGMNSTYYMAGIAYDDHVRDMLPNQFLTPGQPKSVIQTASTYWLDVQEGQTYTRNNQFYLAAKYGGFKVPTNYVPYATPVTSLPLSTWHTTTNTLGPNCTNCNLQPDNYFSAAQANQMVAGLSAAFASIGSSISASSTAFSFTSPQLTVNNNASYSSTYNPANWTGDVIGSSVSFDTQGNPTLTQSWSAASLLNAQAPTSRIIATCCTATGQGLPFEWSNLTSTVNPVIARTDYNTFSNVVGVSPTAQSGPNFLSYLRGVRTLEQANGGSYRTRTSVLGDITDSKLNPVGPPNAPLSDAFNPGYSAFKSTYQSRPTVVYVGANDGMMHAFSGTVPGGGRELFAYIPSFVYGSDATGPVSGLASLGNPNFVHHNLVDATPETFDIDFNNTQGQSHTSPDWHTVLIGGLGNGGTGYYAIDVTNPTTITSETALASKVLWEFTDPDMGDSFGDPTVVKTKEYGWVVILTSGYNNSSGTGYIFIVNPKTGVLLQKIAVGNGADGLPSDGLTYGSAYVQSYADGTADSYYVGDLNGHLWRLDLTPAAGPYAAPVQIAALADSSGNPQPMTTRPLIEIQPGTQKRYVMIGTGRLLAPSDIDSTDQQSFYAIIDGTASQFNTNATLPAGETFPLNRSDLVNDTTTLTSGIGSTPSAPSGWYVDLNATGTSPAERIDINPTANYGIVAFAANTPLGDICDPSGTTRIFGINFGTGGSVLVNHTNAIIDSSTALTGIATDINITNVAGSLRITSGSSNGVVANIPGQLAGTNAFKQLNWSEIQSAD